MTLVVVEIWDGQNYIAIIKALSSINQELKIRVQGKKLIVKDTEAGFYRCIPIGSLVEIPKRECEPDTTIQDPPPKESRIRESCNSSTEDIKVVQFNES